MIYVYEMSPVDFWQGWQPATAVVTSEVDEFGQPPEGKVSRQEYDAAWDLAAATAAEAGWEGDIRGEVYVSALPAAGAVTSKLLLGWKQDNNGTTYIASPYPLSYLSEAGWTATRSRR